VNSDFAVDINSTLLECLEKLEKNKSGVVFVVDERKVVGSISDGDIRRAALRVPPVTEISEIMNKSPFVASSFSDLAGHRRFLQRENIKVVPFLDSSGHIKEFVNVSQQRLVNIQALIQAGGFGKRLGNLTAKIPKPLLNVNGAPLIQYSIDRLRASANISKVYFALHYKAQLIQDFVCEYLKQFEMDFDFIYEERPLGTLGAASYLSEDGPGDLVILNSDLICDVDIDAVLWVHSQQQNDATVVVVPYKHQVPFGVIQTSGESVLAVAEKPESTHLVLGGINVLSLNALRMLEHGVYVDLPDFLNRSIAAKLKVGYYYHNGDWLDVGLPEQLAKAQNKDDL
jgi:dTDP-glucose pyrophosphorylase